MSRDNECGVNNKTDKLMFIVKIKREIHYDDEIPIMRKNYLSKLIKRNSGARSVLSSKSSLRSQKKCRFTSNAHMSLQSHRSYRCGRLIYKQFM